MKDTRFFKQQSVLPAALVMNCHYNGLAIIRELGQHGVSMTAMDHRRSVGTYSRYARYIKCPNPLVEESRFIDFLFEHGRLYDQRPIVFPTNDHWAVALARAKQRLSERFVVCVAEPEVVELVLDKPRFARQGVHADWMVPRSWTADETDAVPLDAYPIIAKPNCRVIASDDAENQNRLKRFGQLRLTVLKSPSALQQFRQEHESILSDFFFQEYVAGLSDCMYTVGVYVDAEHNIRGLFSGRKVRGFPPDSGDCIVGEVESVPAALKDLTQRICREIGYTGIAEFEFKRDVVSGKYRLIEINPRSWSWIGITPACGINLPWIAYTDLAGIEYAHAAESDMPNGSVKWVRIVSDLPNCLYANRRAGYPEWSMSVRQWWRSLHAERLVTAEFAWADPLPGLVAVFAAMRNRLVAGCHRVAALLRSVARSRCRSR